MVYNLNGDDRGFITISIDEGDNFVSNYYFTDASIAKDSSSHTNTSGSLTSIIDGNLTTAFTIAGEPKTNGNYSAIIDLGYSRYIKNLVIKLNVDSYFGEMGNGYGQLYGSNDVSNWTLIATISESSYGTYTEAYNITTNYRYLKFYIYTPGSQGGNPTFIIYEIYTDTPPYENSGLKIDSSSGSYYLAKEVSISSPFRLYNGSNIISLALVDIDNPNASGFRIYTNAGVKAIAKSMS